jgi:hypothetical protein
MRFLIAFLLLYAFHLKSAKTAVDETPISAKKWTERTYTQLIVKSNSPFKKRTAVRRDELSPLHLIHNNNTHSQNCCCRMLESTQLIYFEVDVQLNNNIRHKADFSYALTLGCLYPKHTFW